MPRIILTLVAFCLNQLSLFAQVKYITLCPGSSPSFSVPNMPGKTYQWQIMEDGNHAYSNLANTAIFSGATTNNLHLTNAGTALYGSAYRCIISDAQGLLIPDTNYLTFATVWTGAASAVWNNPANWSCGILPDSSTDVIVEAGNVQVNANSACRSLKVKSSATVQLGSGVTLNIANKKGPDAVLHSHVRLIDSLLFKLNSDTALLNQGVYEFSYTLTDPAFAIGDIIVGEQAKGYARKVISINKQTQKVILQTTQASLADIFMDADYTMIMNTDSGDAGGSLPGQPGFGLNGVAAGYSFDLSGTTLYSIPGVSVKVVSGNIKINGDWDIDFKYRAGKIKNFNLAAKNLGLNADMVVRVETTGNFELPQRTVPVDVFHKGFWFYVPIFGPIGVPVYAELALDLKASVEGRSYRQTSCDILVSSNNSMNVSISYADGQWQTTNNTNTTTTVSAVNPTLQAGASFQTSLGAELSFRLYKVLGPYAEMSVISNGETNVNLANPVLWDFSTNAYMKNKLGLNAEIMVGEFEQELADYSKSWKSNEVNFITPFEMQKVTTVALAGKPNNYLTPLIKVAVLDNLGEPQPNVNVFFKVKSGGGIVDDLVILTDADGIAATKWKLGPASETLQILEASALNADGSLIEIAPILFTAIHAAPPIVSSTNISCVTRNSALSGGDVTSQGSTVIIARGVCWNETGSPTASNSKTNDGVGTGNFVSGLNGLLPDLTYYVRAYAINETDTAYGIEFSFRTQVDTGIAVTIGTQTWMKRNLDVDTFRNGDPIPFFSDALQFYSTTSPAWCYYDNNAANGNIYGKLYNGYAAVDPRGLCPVGWHVPTAAQMDHLGTLVGRTGGSQGNYVAGKNLKATGNLWEIPDGTNCFGFSALPGGVSQNEFRFLGIKAIWYTSTPGGIGDTTTLFTITLLGSSLLPSSTDVKRGGMSIRCIKD